MRTKLGRCLGRTGGSLLLMAGLAAVLIGLSPAPAAAQTCTQDEYNTYNGLTAHPKTLSCTANDVSITNVTGVTIISGGTGGRCTEGSSCTFAANFLIQTTSSKTRSNIGLFFGRNSAINQNGAISGDCDDFILSPTYQCPDDTSLTCGDPTYEELDQSINGETAATSCLPGGTCKAGGCGDTSSTDGGGTGQQTATFDIAGVNIPSSGPSLVACTAPLTGTCYLLPECTSWYQPTTNVPVCDANPSSFPWGASADAVPGTTSKCNCTTLQIPVQPVVPSVTVAKACSLDGTTYSNSCTFSGANLEGGTVTYKVTINNTSSTGGVYVDQICDNRYGQIWPVTGTQTCAAGTVGSIVSGSSSTCGSLGDITTSASCTFQAVQTEDLTIIDTVSVSGHSDVVTTIPLDPNPTNSNTVTVISGQNPSTATTTKGLAGASLGSACATVNYNVTVTNTSPVDENLSLSVPTVSPFTALHDSAYNDITSLHGDAATTGSVVGTTCGVDTASHGLGTLSSLFGGGAFPATLTAPNGTYTCEFAGVLCGAVGTVIEPGTGACSTGDTGVSGTCTNTNPPPPATVTSCTSNGACDATCSGIGPQPDAVTAHLTGDEGEAVSQTENPFNVSVCITPTPSGGPE